MTNAHGNQRRKDFTLEELKSGSVLYFLQVDNLSGKAIYRLHIKEATAGRLVFDVANVTLMKYLIIPLFHPGEMQSIYYLERESDRCLAVLRYGAYRQECEQPHRRT